MTIDDTAEWIMLKVFTYGVQFMRHFVAQFGEVAFSYRAATLAFATLLAIVPLLSVGLTVLSAFPVFDSVDEKIESIIINHVVIDSREVVQEQLFNFASQVKRLSFVGLALLLVTALLLIRTVEKIFNAIWHVKKNRRALKAMLVYWLVLIAIPLLLGASIIVSELLLSNAVITTIYDYPGINKATPFILTSFAFMLLYWVAPNCKVPIVPAIISAVVAGLLFELAKQGFSYYITHFGSYQVIYGAFAAIPLFMIWIYIVWVIILFGGMLSYALAHRKVFSAKNQ